MKTQNSEFAADQVKKQDKAMSESGSDKAKHATVGLPFGYGENSVPYLAADFDAALEDFSEYS